VAIRLLVDRTINLQAVVSTRSLRIVSPQFRAATVTVARPAYAATVEYPLYQTSINYRRLANSLLYRRLQASDLVLDPDTKNRFFRDLDFAEITDAVALEFSTTFYSLSYLADLVALQSEKQFDHSVEASDAIDIVVFIARFFESEFGVFDDSYLTFQKASQDIVTSTDVITSRDFSKGLAETPTLRDTRAVITFSRPVVDAVSTEDFYSAVVDFARDFSETISAVSDARPVFDLGLSAFDTAVVTESISFGYDSVLTDEVAASDAHAIEYSRPETDQIVASDLFDRVVEYSRAFEDFFILDDSATLDAFAKDTYAVKTNVFGFSDESAFTFGKLAADTVEATDSLSYDVGTTLVDAFVINESLVVSKRSAASSVLNVGALNTAPFNN
jgi:hypothetical protein